MGVGSPNGNQIKRRLDLIKTDSEWIVLPFFWYPVSAKWGYPRRGMQFP